MNNLTDNNFLHFTKIWDYSDINFKNQFYHSLDDVLYYRTSVSKSHLENDYLFRRVFPKKLYEFNMVCHRFLE
ncbi:hypothetical protein B2G50_17765 [Leptospira interrogans serovar Canicola]|nr:hypothetical protein B2G50_17765 [Leptospira interrogans serovar Canicola]